MKALLRPFVAGLITLLPLGLTLIVFAWFASLVAQFIGPTSFVGQLLQKAGWNFGSSVIGAYAGGAVFTLILIYGLGLLVEYWLKDKLNTVLGRIFSRIPIVRTVYDASSRIAQLLSNNEETDLRAMTPVACQFGSEKGATFPALLPTPETVLIDEREYHVVMIPTAPVPIGGAIIYVPKECVRPLDCGVDGLMNIYMSMGTSNGGPRRT